MPLDIRRGDVLVVDGKDYPIRSVALWTGMKPARTLSFRRMAQMDASTKRNPAPTADGKRSLPVVYLAGLRCMPLDPVDGEMKRRLELESPYTMKQTVITDSTSFVQLVVEDLG